MGKTILLAAVLLVAAATPAFAQGVEVAQPDGASPPREEGSLYSGAYEVTEDGDLVYGGDVGFECEYLVRMGAPAEPGAEDVTVDGGVVEPLTREAVELCAEAGFPPRGATFDASVASASAGGTGLPETGGPAFPAPLLPAAVVPLAAGALLLAFRVVR
ncbi:MAG: hypothetical protein M3N33_10185 [Actinomycetota bacterium]|nr:hypothetical protein [Actinomycetota bacterium]